MAELKICPINLFQDDMEFDANKCDYNPNTKSCCVGCNKALRTLLTRKAKEAQAITKLQELGYLEEV